MGFLVFVALAAGIVVWLIGMYNGLVRGRNEFKNAWSQIDVQLKRRYDLIPNLLETVKGYAAVTSVRRFEAVDQGPPTGDQRRRGHRPEQGQGREHAVANPALALRRQRGLSGPQGQPELPGVAGGALGSTENKISFARQHYNDSAMSYNNKTEMFPSNLVASTFNFEPAEFFEVEELRSSARRRKVSFQ